MKSLWNILDFQFLMSESDQILLEYVMVEDYLVKLKQKEPKEKESEKQVLVEVAA